MVNEFGLGVQNSRGLTCKGLGSTDVGNTPMSALAGPLPVSALGCMITPAGGAKQAITSKSIFDFTLALYETFDNREAIVIAAAAAAAAARHVTDSHPKRPSVGGFAGQFSPL